MKKKKQKNSSSWVIGFIIVVICWSIFSSLMEDNEPIENYQYSSKTFNLISSSENKIFDSEIQKFAAKEGFSIHIEYDDTLKIIKRLNKGELYDAVWLSNSIWMYSVDTSKVKISDTKFTSINPIVFAIRKSKADELGFVDKTLYTQDIVNAVQDGKLKFSMSNPVTTNSGASAYLGLLTTLAGNPEVLTSDMLQEESLKEKLKEFFKGVERSSGNEDYLEELFVKGDYEAVFTYESSIININKSLAKKNKESLYALYPVDGVSISDSPIGYIDQKDERKKENYDKLVEFLAGKKGQALLAKYGRRTWYGGITESADLKVFNPEWGIDTKHYISPLKYPSTSVIKEALALYQSSIRKPVHVVFCLDYSGSMAGSRIKELRDAMDYILTDRAQDELLQFTGEDIVEIVPFSFEYEEVWHSNSEEGMKELLRKINAKNPNGATALYPAVERGIWLLAPEDRERYNTSIIVMTDGEGNIGSFDELKKTYKELPNDIPIYSIQFGAASRRQLDKLADLSNGKVFDGTTNLIDAFMEVRGYN